MLLYSAEDCQRRKPDDGITILDYGVSTDEMSVVRAELHGSHVGQRNRRSTTTYIVTEGRMNITVDSEALEANAGDIVVAPVGSRRELQGKATLVIINTPKFDPADEQ